jgi:predicted ABC-type ATPase
MIKEKKILIIAGPNGAGKTTFATEFLPQEAECPNFIDEGEKNDEYTNE